MVNIAPSKSGWIKIRPAGTDVTNKQRKIFLIVGRPASAIIIHAIIKGHLIQTHQQAKALLNHIDKARNADSEGGRYMT